jgi:hypothetical protein
MVLIGGEVDLDISLSLSLFPKKDSKIMGGIKR